MAGRGRLALLEKNGGEGKGPCSRHRKKKRGAWPSPKRSKNGSLTTGKSVSDEAISSKRRVNKRTAALIGRREGKGIQKKLRGKKRK